MSEIEIEPKNILKTALFGGIGAIFIIIFFMSWTDIDPGEEGFVYRPYTGGIDTSEINSSTMECKKHSGLYFIGEVLDVTGHLGGHNFQWAWSSGFLAGQNV